MQKKRVLKKYFLFQVIQAESGEEKFIPGQVSILQNLFTIIYTDTGILPNVFDWGYDDSSISNAKTVS
jgi:hypothetical protein